MSSRIANLEPESLQRASCGDDIVVSVAAAKKRQERAESDVTGYYSYAGTHHSIPTHTASITDVQTVHIRCVSWSNVDEIGRPDRTERETDSVIYVDDFVDAMRI